MTAIAGPLKWHGGKAYLASRIVAMMPPHLHYVEPFAGGLSVLLAKDPEGVSEVANDIHGELSNFWVVMQLEEFFKQFHRVVGSMPFSEKEYGRALGMRGIDNQVFAAASFFVRCRMSLAGRMDAFAPLSRNRIRRGMNEQASAWMTCVDSLPQVHERLRRVVVLNRDALKVIEQQDAPQTLFYLDPPYLHETRSTTGEYAHEMTAEQHKELLILLNSIEGKFMLSGYHSPMYDEWAFQSNFTCVEFDLPNNAAGGKEKQRKTECVWMNFNPADPPVP